MRASGTQHTLDDAEVFVDLVLGDDELVRAEFDALIAACWEAPCGPPTRRRSPSVGDWAERPPRRWPRRGGLWRGRVPSARPDARQRGPPPYHSNH
ncbi:hypothetical protein AB0H36_11860 [Kribbella sp. NPDC050820]|uniref:hypothetical protein n=1 Tax=Kribbella sp. NPDC050820 TaxID=3155408 RepID=UPI0033DBE273